jgi:hypothetical protein
LSPTIWNAWNGKCALHSQWGKAPYCNLKRWEMFGQKQSKDVLLP